MDVFVSKLELVHRPPIKAFQNPETFLANKMPLDYVQFRFKRDFDLHKIRFLQTQENNININVLTSEGYLPKRNPIGLNVF